MPELLEIEIRECRKGDLVLLEQILPTKEYHKKRFLDQKAGRGTYLIAWRNNRPVGHLNIRWGSAQKPKIKPMLNCMEIVPELRSRGIGAQLLVAAEKLIKKRGLGQAELMVGVNNTRAKEFYERSGFKDPGYAPEIIRWPANANDPHSRIIKEECLYLIKDL